VGFEVYLECFGETQRTGIPRVAVRSLFPVVEQESEPDYWRLRYDKTNSCEIAVTPLKSDSKMLAGLLVDCPCVHLDLWKGLLRVLQMGSVVMFWPGGPPVLAEGGPASDLPKGMIDSIGPPKFADSADELLRLVRK